MENAQKAVSAIPNASETQKALDTVTQTIQQLMEQRGALISQLNGVDSNRQTNSGIAALQDQVTTAQLQGSISTDSLKQQVTEYNKMLAETNLKSTVSGTITSLNVKKDDMYTGGVILTIDGMDEYIIETNIDEYDIPDVKEGMKVLIKTDATRDEELEGVVTYTAPASTAVSSASTAAYGAAYGGAAGASTGDAKYKVKIAVKTPNDRLRLGMNAKLSIIQSQKENVWTVPYESLLQRDDGSYYIEILKEGSETETEELNVQKGIEGTYYVEVISDALNENMNVVIPQVNDLNSLEAIIEAMGANGGM
jgi:multidrug resistance efflux pump